MGSRSVSIGIQTDATTQDMVHYEFYQVALFWTKHCELYDVISQKQHGRFQIATVIYLRLASSIRVSIFKTIGSREGIFFICSTRFAINSYYLSPTGYHSADRYRVRLAATRTEGPFSTSSLTLRQTCISPIKFQTRRPKV